MLTSLCPSLFSSPSDHYADDLEVELEAAMLDDFGAQLEDGSPREVSRMEVFFLSTAARDAAFVFLREAIDASPSSVFSFCAPLLSLRVYRRNEAFMLAEAEKARSRGSTAAKRRDAFFNVAVVDVVDVADNTHTHKKKKLNLFFNQTSGRPHPRPPPLRTPLRPDSGPRDHPGLT